MQEILIVGQNENGTTVVRYPDVNSLVDDQENEIREYLKQKDEFRAKQARIEELKKKCEIYRNFLKATPVQEYPMDCPEFIELVQRARGVAKDFLGQLEAERGKLL